MFKFVRQSLVYYRLKISTHERTGIPSPKKKYTWWFVQLTMRGSSGWRPLLITLAALSQAPAASPLECYVGEHDCR